MRKSFVLLNKSLVLLNFITHAALPHMAHRDAQEAPCSSLVMMLWRMCRDAKESPQKRLYAVCGHGVIVLLFLAISMNVFENILRFASVEVAQLVDG